MRLLMVLIWASARGVSVRANSSPMAVSSVMGCKAERRLAAAEFKDLRRLCAQIVHPGGGVPDTAGARLRRTTAFQDEAHANHAFTEVHNIDIQHITTSHIKWCR
jgi:hypothetical protein